MRRFVSVLLFAAIAAAPAIAGSGVAWGGVGWYIIGQSKSPGSTSVAVGGPYATRDTCENSRAQFQSQSTNSNYTYWCNYETVAWATPSDDY